MTEDEIKKYHQKVDENIRTYGYHSTFVYSDNSLSFCYSTGIYKSFGIPEIFISSLPENLSNILIQKYADKFKHIYPDTTGHFPNDAEYDYDQVILGQFVN